MVRRRTDRAMGRLREIARTQSASPPLGYEHYNVDWSKLHPKMRGVVCMFADALKEVREHELDLLKLTVDCHRAMFTELSDNDERR